MHACAALALTLWLQGLAEHAGARLLRLKGLVALAEEPERPAVIHAIQHMVHPLEWLEAWPGADRRRPSRTGASPAPATRSSWP